jgi:hypothetical protein
MPPTVHGVIAGTILTMVMATMDTVVDMAVMVIMEVGITAITTAHHLGVITTTFTITRQITTTMEQGL